MSQITVSPKSLEEIARMLLPSEVVFQSLSHLLTTLNDRAASQSNEIIRGAAFDLIAVLKSYREEFQGNRLSEQEFLDWLLQHGFKVASI